MTDLTNLLAPIEERCPERADFMRWPMQCELEKGHTDRRCLATIGDGLGDVSWN